jgi:tRNA A-37 threonylcarbamoyl transferase component Bud32
MNCPRCSAPADEQTLREFGGVCPKCLLDFSEEQDAPAFPNLEILEMIGQGGMGVVYKARQKNLDRIVALKVLSPHLSDDPEFVERFTREAKALAQLGHPNIVGIHDSGIHDRVPYLVMEYVDGTPLRKVLASAKFTPDRALEVIPQICDALQYAHTHGVVHRDIKPENILIDRQGRVKIADFGLAKLSKMEESRITQSGYVMGTPRYMAPEQFEASGRVDHRADIYSLGVVFYEMLTGEVPMGRFKPPSAKADVDRRLDPVVLKSLEREPEDRYQSAGEVKERVANFKQAPATPAVAEPESSHPLKKAAGTIAWMGFIALAAILPGYTVDNHIFPKIFLPVGGALLLAAGVLWLLSFAFSPVKSGAETTLRTNSSGCLLAFVAMAAVVAIAALVLLGYTKAESPMPPAVMTPPPPVEALPPMPTPAPIPGVPLPAGEWQQVDKRFDLDQVWPAAAELPSGSLPGKESGDAEALERAGLPKDLHADLKTLRVISFDRGRATLVGLTFANEVARRRWSRDERFAGALNTGIYRLSGDSDSAVYIRYDGSNAGAAIAESLWPVIKSKLNQPRKK